MNEKNQISILVIEDEPEIRKFLSAVLESHDFKIKFAETAKEGLKLFTSHPADILLLDLGLPDMDGIDVIKKIREWNNTPIIVLSARGQEADKIAALELGADDYLTKPFGTGELLARIKVALRHFAKVNQENITVFESGSLKIDFDKRVVLVEKAEVHLTPIEYKLLTSLVKYAGKVITQKQLLKEVWGKNSDENSHYLRIYVQHLREKLNDDPLNPKYILTEAGIGYRFKV